MKCFKAFLYSLLVSFSLNATQYSPAKVSDFETVSGNNIPFIKYQNSKVSDKINDDLNDFVKSNYNSYIKDKKKAIAKGFTEKDVKQRFSFDNSYMVKLNENDILSILQSIYIYEGGANGERIVKAFNYNLKTGESYKLKDIFLKDADYITKINKIIKWQISQFDNSKSYHFKSITADSNFYFTPEGLVIFYNLYDIAPRSEGAVMFSIPWKSIKSIIKESISY